MRLFYVSLVSAGSVLLPLSASLARWGRLKEQYLPVLLLFIAGLLNESLSIYHVYAHDSNALNSNIYVLVEHVLICWLFILFSKSTANTWVRGMILAGILVWFCDNFILRHIESNNSMFRVFSSLCVSYLSIDVITHFIIYRKMGRSPSQELLFSVGFLLFHSYKTFVEAFHLFPASISGQGFFIILWSILSIINILSNILFTIAVLCLPRKKNYIIHW